MSSPEALVMLHPSRAFAKLARGAPRPGPWLALRRVFLIVLIYGCAVSLMTSGRITLRLLIPAALYWSFVPLLEIAGLRMVYRRSDPLPFSHATDLFLMGNTPWSLLLLAFATMWAFFPAGQVNTWQHYAWMWDVAGVLALVWSCYIDYRFFGSALQRRGGSAIRALAVQKAVTWIAGLAWFLAPAGWQVVASKVGM